MILMPLNESGPTLKKKKNAECLNLQLTSAGFRDKTKMRTLTDSKLKYNLILSNLI